MPNTFSDLQHQTVAGVVDLNDMTVAANYYIQNSNSMNLPYAEAGFLTVREKDSKDSLYQAYLTQDSNKGATRTCKGGSNLDIISITTSGGEEILATITATASELGLSASGNILAGVTGTPSGAKQLNGSITLSLDTSAMSAILINGTPAISVMSGMAFILTASHEMGKGVLVINQLVPNSTSVEIQFSYTWQAAVGTVWTDWNKGEAPAVQYTITFDGDGGMPIPDPITVTAGTSFVVPASPEKDGYDFVEWQDMVSGLVYQAGEIVVPTGDMSLKALWEEEVAIKDKFFIFSTGSGTATKFMHGETPDNIVSYVSTHTPQAGDFTHVVYGNGVYCFTDSSHNLSSFNILYGENCSHLTSRRSPMAFYVNGWFIDGHFVYINANGITLRGTHPSNLQLVNSESITAGASPIKYAAYGDGWFVTSAGKGVIRYGKDLSNITTTYQAPGTGSGDVYKIKYFERHNIFVGMNYNSLIYGHPEAGFHTASYSTPNGSMMLDFDMFNDYFVFCGDSGYYAYGKSLTNLTLKTVTAPLQISWKNVQIIKGDTPDSADKMLYLVGGDGVMHGTSPESLVHKMSTDIPEWGGVVCGTACANNKLIVVTSNKIVAGTSADDLRGYIVQYPFGSNRPTSIVVA